MTFKGIAFHVLKTYQVIHVFMREYCVDVFAKMALTPGLPDTVSQERHWC